MVAVLVDYLGLVEEVQNMLLLLVIEIAIYETSMRKVRAAVWITCLSKRCSQRAMEWEKICRAMSIEANVDALEEQLASLDDIEFACHLVECGVERLQGILDALHYLRHAPLGRNDLA